LYLSDIIKDAIHNELFIETYDTLCFHDNSVVPDEAAFVEDEVDDESDEAFEEVIDLDQNVDLVYK